MFAHCNLQVKLPQIFMRPDAKAIERMKLAGWKYRPFYFHKRLGENELVIEMRLGNIFLCIYDRKRLESLGKKQKCKTLAEALAKTLLLEKKYS